MNGRAPGAVLFSRYAFPPNELGYCGPDDPGVLLTHATSGTVPAAEIRDRARQFEGAWVYLELIAAAAGIADPLDARVVEAYWIGNDLLDAVDPETFLRALRDRLPGQLTHAVRPETALAHHSFHVFAVYPWVGLLGVRAGIALSVLESCRIRWGTVTGPREPVEAPGRAGLPEDRVPVRSQPLAWDGRSLTLGRERTEMVRWTPGDAWPAGSPQPGDVVACHWDWVCDRLTDVQAEQLATRSAAQLAMAAAS